MKIVVIGGVAAGTSAAARAKRVNPDAEIIIFERDSDISYSGCGLPYYISDIVENRDKLVIYTPKEFEVEKGVEVKVGSLVEDILVQEKEVLVKDLKSNQSKRVRYDRLLIATGATPFLPAIDGSELEGILSLRNLHDADRINRFISNNKPKSAVIVGGGYIGLEVAESLLVKGIRVSVVEREEQLLTNLDGDMAEIVSKHLQEKGVDVIVGDGVKRLKGDGVVGGVITQSGRELEADLVILAIGVRPNVELAKKAGIEIGETGAIKVNERMQTSVKDIYAAGDCVESKSIITGKEVWVPLGSTANKQGRVAGTNIAGGQGIFKGILGTAITKVCDLGVARTGLTHREASQAGYKVARSTIIKDSNHAGYYPNHKQLNIKLTVQEENGEILGGQIIGEDGADKKVDILATAIHNKMKANELIDLDLAYAPPFSVPKDGLMIAGVVADKNRDI